MNAPVQGATLAPNIAVTLDVLAAEIELAGARCIFLDRLVADVMQNLPETERTRMVEGMHAVDLLSQHLTSLSAFARTMSANAPPVTAPVGPALAEITLGALVERMTVGLGGDDNDKGELPDEDGDVDLF
jgi:hypothetical protein